MSAAKTSDVLALRADASRCVKCALCLPHCPTYRLKGEEGDSPRGRIELIQSLAEGAIVPTPGVLEHLDGCLDCRACEAVCPAGVPYGRLIDGARSMLGAHGRTAFLTRLLCRLVSRPAALAAALVALRPSAFLAPPRLRPYLGAVRRLPRLARGPAEGKPVALFLGCIARTLDTEALAAGARLLAAAGYRVEVPRRQTCCGALAQHGGDREGAAALAHRNAEAFAGDAPIAAGASGCTAQLLEYEALLGDGGAFSRRVRGVSDLLAEAVEDGRLRFRTGAPLRVALHTPCTQRNVLRSQAPARCLAALPGITVVELPPGCCGAAGSYFLDRPRDAERLREPLLAAVRKARADMVLTTNVGCRLHLAAGLGADEAPPVKHLASFLAERLDKPG